MNERLSSLLRSKKAPNERDMHLSLWKNYVVMGCCIAPPSHPVEHHFSSSDARHVSFEFTLKERKKEKMLL